MKKIGILGIGLILLAALLGLQDLTIFFRAYLVAFLFWFAIPMGAMALRLIHYLTWGNWGKALNVFLESAIRTVPLAVLLFIPVALGMKHIYPWINPSHELEYFLTGFKGAYLTSSGFLIRAAIALGAWLFISSILTRVGKGNENWREAPSGVQGFSGISLLAFVVTMTMAITDWAMSLKPEWFSTIYGVMFMIGQGLSALSFGIVVIVYFYTPEQRSKIPADVYHDLGKLMLAFTMLWTYMNLSQFLIIWGANVSEEVTWYIERFKNGWQYAGFTLLLVQFILPFVILLSRDVKRNPGKLGKIALFIFCARIADFFWTVKPAFSSALSLHLVEILLWAGLGAVWITAFFMQKEAFSKK